MPDVAIITRSKYERFDNFDEGVAALLELEADAYNIIKVLKSEQKLLVMTRFRQGAVVSALTQEKEGTERIVQELSSSTGMSRTALYDCRRFYRCDQFRQSEEVLHHWLNSVEHGATWTAIRNWLNKYEGKDQEAYAESQMAKIEKTAIKLEEMTEQFEYEQEHFAKGQIRYEGKGVIEKAREVTKEAIEKIATKRVDKNRPLRDERYLDFIRNCPCCVSGMTQDIVAHHVLTHGKSVKCADYAAIPLNNLLHQELHIIGKDTFAEKYSVDWWEEIAQHISMYVWGRRIA